jgi:glycerophosphoryl diester phosphodiesterase
VIVSAHDGYPRWVDSGADFIEIDVRRDPRKKIVLAHDEVRWWKRYVTFDELLHRVDPRVGLHIDLKEAGFEDELVHKALAGRAPEKVVVTPDFESSARAIKAAYKEVRVSPLDFVTVDQRYATQEWLAAADKPVWVWTVDDPARMEWLMDQGVECLITNRPDLALALRSARR